MDSINSGLQATTELIATQGVNAETMGLADQIRAQADSARKTYAVEAKEMMKQAQEYAKAADDIQIEGATPEARAESRDKRDKSRLLAQKLITDASQIQAKAQAMIVASVKAELAVREELLQRWKQQEQIARSELEISKGVYGVAGLSVAAYKKVVASLQEQKNLTASMLADVQARIAGGDNSMHVLKEELRLRGEMNKLTADQVNMLKELRDGYLDAVQAQAFGAGAFEKILVTQEKNLGIGMDKGLVKQNLMLGAIEDRARASNVMPTRFGNYGVETLSGAPVEGDLLRDQMSELAKNTTDALGRAGMEMATEISLSAQSMGKIPGAANAASQGLNNFHRALGERLGDVAGMGGLQSGPSADVVAGNAMRNAKSGVPVISTGTGTGTGTGTAPVPVLVPTLAPAPAPVPVPMPMPVEIAVPLPVPVIITGDGAGAGTGTGTGTRAPASKYGAGARGPKAKKFGKACDMMMSVITDMEDAAADEYDAVPPGGRTAGVQSTSG